MEIDKSKLKLGIWYEDENGNLIKDEWFDYESFFKDEKPPFVEE